ncbi:MAG: MoaD/ThiS family protein [Alphaproteobacteria bacterium]|nr:MoaD/ThiS family protein [Alphaproteobacteria bacterium]
MPVVHLTPNLRAAYPDLRDVDELVVEGDTAAAVVAALDARFPGLGHYLVDERGRLRKHVNLFVDGELIGDRQALSDAVGPDTPVHIIQALSGG